MLRRVLLILAAIGALALGLETAVTYLVQRGMEEALKRQYGLPEDLRARINSFPLVLSLARNRIRDLRLEWAGEASFRSEEGSTSVPYGCELRLCDMELDMPAVLQGRLEIRSLSRLLSSLSFELPELCPLLGVSFISDDGSGFIIAGRGTEEVKYEVHVSGSREIEFRPLSSLMNSSGLPKNYEPVIEGLRKTFILEGFPLEITLLTVEVEEGKLSMRMRVDEWEGYLDASIDSL
ncbi:MAG: hypothetical protein H5T72_08755 [Actinobacteria bacterium]|nr:hypothetical protein [Actinomycetota bacterium]